MCGILGSVNIPFDDSLLKTIAHRGPDDKGLKVFSFGDNTITLGHRRLSIVDLSSAGHQPMSSECGNFEIVFNGEIYNHKDLRLKLSDIKFRGHSDTETIVNYIARFGIESIKDFNGIFGLAVYDKVSNKIYISRDRYGVKPIYYYFEGGRLIFSSELRPILKHTKTHLDKESLALLLRLRYCPSPYTLFANVFKLLPGHTACFDLENNSFSIKSFIKPIKTNHYLSFKDAVDHYAYLFENAIKRQLMSDVDIGMLLSGGVDSALVSHYAAKHYSGILKTFTVGFEGESPANELVEARAIAQMLGTEHREVILNAEQFEDSFKSLILTIEEPLGTTSTIPLYHLNELVSQHVKVVLSGQGADEPLGGYPRYQGELYRMFIPPFVWNMANRYGEKLFEKNEKFNRAIYALGETDVIKRFDKTYALFKNEEINQLIGVNSTRSCEAISYFYHLLNGQDRKPIEALMSNDLRMNLSDDLLLLSDKISMHFSIEARVPLLDNELVDFIESLPYQYRLKVGKGKIIHKKFAEKCLPSRIVNQKKKGFMTPAEGWFKEKIGSKYQSLLTEGNSKFNQHFDAKKVLKVFDEHNRGINREKQLFTLISIYYWLEEFI